MFICDDFWNCRSPNSPANTNMTVHFSHFSSKNMEWEMLKQVIYLLSNLYLFCFTKLILEQFKLEQLKLSHKCLKLNKLSLQFCLSFSFTFIFLICWYLQLYLYFILILKNNKWFGSRTNTAVGLVVSELPLWSDFVLFFFF